MITTRFNVNDKVYIYKEGKLIQVTVENIDARVSATENTIKYGFLFSKQPGAPVTWFAENEVFETKAELLPR